MGCWNKTCGLTGLPILSGDPVYVFVLEKNNHRDRCYSTAFWRPVLVPFESYYNDYGAGENSHGVALEPILDGLRENLVEMEQGENEYHDVPVKKDNFNEDEFFESVHEGRLSIVDFYQRTAEIDYVMMRKDAVDKVLSDHRFEYYVGNEKGTCGYDNSYAKIGFQQYVDAVDNVIKKMKESDEHMRMFGLLPVFDHRQEYFEWKISRSNDDHDNSSLFRPFHVVSYFIREGKEDEAKQFLIEFCKGIYINSFMSAVRKVWMPGAHEGSQSQEWDDYLFLSDMIKGIIKDVSDEFEDEENEE